MTILVYATLLGTQPFCELNIVTRPPILIPRYEEKSFIQKGGVKFFLDGKLRSGLTR